MPNIKAWILACRPKTLVTGISPVLLGSVMAYREDQWQWLPAFLCLAFALFVQIGTNWANDYYDSLKGADSFERKGPQRMVTTGLISPLAMKKAMISVFIIAFVSGCALVPYGGGIFIFLGLICILCGIAYTGGPFPFAYNGLGDIFVFFFFGLVAVNFTFYLQANYFSLDALILSFAPGTLATNLLVVNNYRDVDTDKHVGKNTLVVRFGKQAARYQYYGSICTAFIVPVILFFNGFSLWILLPFILVPKSLHLIQQLKSAQNSCDFSHILEGTAMLLVLYSLLIAIGATLPLH